MNLFAFLCFIVSIACTLLFCVLRLRKPMYAARIAFAPSLLLCFICMNRSLSDPLLVGALLVEVVYNILACCKRVPTPVRQLAFAGGVVLCTAALFRNDIWNLVAPHINFTFLVVFITVIVVVYLWVYPWLSEVELVSTFMLLLFNGLFASLGGIGVFYHFNLGSVLIALGGVLNFVYYITKLFLTRKYEETRFGEFELMSLYIASRTLLVFGFQLAL